MKCNVTRQIATWLQQTDHISILYRVTAGWSYADLISSYSRPIIFWSYFGLQQADHMPTLFWVTAGRSYANLISGYSRPIIFRSYFGLQQAADHNFGLQQADLISGYSRPILFRVTAGRSYFGLQQADLISAKRMCDCRQNKLRLLWNALLTTPYVK